MQFLLGRILEQGSDQFFYVSEPFAEEVELVFLNTCGFISSGREEMFQTLKKLLKKKKKVCLLGCAVQYFEKVVGDAHLSDDELQQWYALKSHSGLFFLSWGELAHFDPKSFFSSFHSSLPQKKGQLACSDNGRFGDFERPQHTRAYTNIDLGFEYVKIAEGCNNHCSFCIIPRIRGKQISLPLETVLQEVKNLISQGVKEIILIAQDTARYGIDLYGKSQLFELLEAIDQLTGDFHYRVLYLYPDLLTRNHLERLTKLRKFIPYFDLPLQHASPRILRAMGRFYDHDMTLSLLAFIKEQFPVHFIRTNIIIGFPGERESDFELLLKFLGEDWFDAVALFEYHDEPLASSSSLADKVDAQTMRARFLQAKKLVEKLQEQRALSAPKENIGTISDLWSDRKGAWKLSVRPFLHCPEIDGEDEIDIDQVVELYDGEELERGVRIKYWL